MYKIGIGITTRNRKDCLKVCLDQFAKFNSPEQKIVIIDDASDKDSYQLVSQYKLPFIHCYSQVQLGVAAAKNECLKRLKDCKYIFLFDDDCFPIAEGWDNNFIDCSVKTGQQFLIFNFNNKRYPIRAIRTENGLHKFETGTGAMMFLTQKVLEVAGGMNKNYGIWGHEHNGYSFRIHNLGLTPHGVFTSPIGCDKFIYSLDIQGIPAWLKGKIKNFKSCEPETIKMYWAREKKTIKTLNEDIIGAFKVEL